METEWNAVLLQTLQCLSRACEEFAHRLEQDEAGVKELRELMSALKELTALRRQLEPQSDSESATVEISFSDEAELWSR